MIVCVCMAVRERDIRDLVSNSQEGLRMRDLRERLGVCSECGKCALRAQCLLRETPTETSRPDAPGAGFPRSALSDWGAGAGETAPAGA
ncbi:MAG: (2Fe-2S)-binding protein [Thioalkalivibrio sp.]|jgi:bacterioferritin-associated ferredoxin|nr:(2Fe-2S)-binding protein [Thioalkalivibrio sp.]